MPSKHELLDYISQNGQVTIIETADHFGCTFSYASNALRSLKHTDLARHVGKIQYTKNVCPRKIFELTDKALQRLEYFNENGCKNKNCSCQKEA